MRVIQRINISVLFLLIITACTPIQTATSIPPVISTLTGAPSSGSTLPASPEPPGAVPSTTGQVNIPPVPASPVWLRIVSPIDQEVVRTSQIEVVGEAATGAVVTVNDQILIVGPDEKFTATVALDEGPNLIEVVASDAQGNELTVELVVIYEP